jgi:hypothetical protein
MSAIELQTVTGLNDILQVNHFTLIVPNPPAGDGNALTIRNMTGVLPVIPEIEAMVLNLHRHSVQFAGKAKRHGSFDATYTDTSDRKVTDLLEKWYAATQNGTTGLPKPKSSYATIGQVNIYDANNVAVITRKFKGLWIGKVAPVSLDGNSNEALKYSVTWNYDLFE